jgi:hypothetical protein
MLDLFFLSGHLSGFSPVGSWAPFFPQVNITMFKLTALKCTANAK